jgi:hypothetical protein
MVDELDGANGPAFIEEQEALPAAALRAREDASRASVFTNHRGGLRAAVVEGPGSELLLAELRAAACGIQACC